MKPWVQVRQQRQTEATAEWIVDITTWADRQGRAMQFADAYNQSHLKQQNEQQLQKFLANEEHQVRHAGCPDAACCAVLCCALSCRAVLCRAVPCCAMLYALPCPALPYPALPCPALPCPALPCPALPRPAPALPCPAALLS